MFYLPDNDMGVVPWENLPDEIWTLILKKAPLTTLIQLQNVNTRFEALVETNNLFADFIKVEEIIIKALGTFQNFSKLIDFNV